MNTTITPGHAAWLARRIEHALAVERTARLAWATHVLGRRIETFRALTPYEAERLKQVANKKRSP
jgi:hypothetical protein